MPDPAIATNAKFALDFEQSWGVAKGTPKLRQIAFISEGLTGTQQLIDNPSIRGDFNPVAPSYGKKAAGGSLVHIPTLRTAPLFQKWLTGDLVNSGTDPNLVYTSKLLAAIPPGVVAETQIDIGGTQRFIRAEGLRVNRLGIQFQVDGFLQFNADVLGKNVSIQTTTLDAILDDWTAEDPIDNMQIAAADIRLGGIATTAVQSGSIDISSNLNAEDYRVGGAGTRGSLLPGVYAITGQIKFVVESAALLSVLDAGGASSLFIKWAAGANRYFAIELPKIYLEKVQPVIQGPGLITVDANFRAVYDAARGSSIVLETGNSFAAPEYA